MKRQWVEVKVTCHHSYLVEVNTSDNNQAIADAENAVLQEVNSFTDMESAMVSDSQLEAFKRHTDRDKILNYED